MAIDAPSPIPVPAPRPRIVVAGAVGSTERLLKALIRHNALVVGVLGLDECLGPGTAGYRRLDAIAEGTNIPYADFRNINDPATATAIRRWEPDLLFVVGLSQLVHRELLNLPRLGCIGFHPTWLPEGRGRAPLVWMALEERPGAATFFLMTEDMDAGPIFVQEPFRFTKDDDAEAITRQTEAAMDRALDRWLPQLLRGEWNPVPQDESRATYYGRRAPADGIIDWHAHSQTILSLVRAVTRPYPGAYSFFRDHKIVVWRAAAAEELRWTGVPGRLLVHDPQKGWLVGTGDGALWLNELEVVSSIGRRTADEVLRVGARLGYVSQNELFHLRNRLAVLESRIARLDGHDGHGSWA